MTDLTPEQKDKRIAELEKLLRAMADNVEELAFRMTAPNEWTPQFITLVGAYRTFLDLTTASEPDAPRIDAAKLAEIADDMAGWLPNDGMTPPEYSACETIQEWRASLLAMIGGQTNEDQ